MAAATAPNIYVQLISSTIGCIGFSLWFKIKGRQVAYSGLGAFLTWLIYLVAYHYTENVFSAVLIASIFVAAFAQVMARINKAPATIFRTSAVFPLIPGSKLYYMMYFTVMRKPHEALDNAWRLIVVCVAIALGFIVVEIISKYLAILQRRIGNKNLG